MKLRPDGQFSGGGSLGSFSRLYNVRATRLVIGPGLKRGADENLISKARPSWAGRETRGKALSEVFTFIKTTSTTSVTALFGASFKEMLITQLAPSRKPPSQQRYIRGTFHSCQLSDSCQPTGISTASIFASLTRKSENAMY
ncbi:Hypothetical protein NTJ_11823 [Nesidiocoris tenuis]|uniref:Uncharacterized protein n=1 Tax=Nesidiocoris tenuis TaxID=355587 RepID=A0ABN7B8A0_9HEMI|nr:Hypothetical protein NTJ_11823 [Nesidiocoris tenuis]